MIDPGGPHERTVDALADDEPVRAGEVIRIRTTGGGGWGDPLDRDPAAVLRDLRWHKVSPRSALDDYAVVVSGSADGDDLRVDVGATRKLRASRRADQAGGRRPFFDRGPGYAALAGGTEAADVDWL